MDKKFFKNTMWVAMSNGIVLLSSIISGFVVPRLLGVTEYGYYQTFALYLTYTGLLHFGFVDGVLLKYVGTEYSDIDKKQFNTNTRFFLLMQLLVSIFLVVASFSFVSGRSRSILLFISIDTFFINLTVYYQYVSQATMRFKDLSIRQVLQAALKIMAVLILYLLHRTGVVSSITSNYYIAGICFVDMMLALWYIYTYREITFGKGYSILKGWTEYIELFKTGLILTLAYQVAHLVFVLDKQFVVKLFDTDTYAFYAFAYSLISMITTVVSAISLVLFPSMKQKKKEDNIKNFDDWISLISIVVFASLAGYFILKYVLIWIVPKYESSLEYLRILFPGLAISCSITIIIFNFYKVFNKIAQYMMIGFIVLGIGTALNCIVYMVFATPGSISIASIITLFLWFLLSQRVYIKEYHTSPWKNLIYVGVLSAVFWISTIPEIHNIIGLIIYIAVFGVVTLLIHGKVLKQYLRKLKH